MAFIDFRNTDGTTDSGYPPKQNVACRYLWTTNSAHSFKKFFACREFCSTNSFHSHRALEDGLQRQEDKAAYLPIREIAKLKKNLTQIIPQYQFRNKDHTQHNVLKQESIKPILFGATDKPNNIWKYIWRSVTDQRDLVNTQMAVNSKECSSRADDSTITAPVVSFSSNARLAPDLFEVIWFSSIGLLEITCSIYMVHISDNALEKLCCESSW